MDLALADAEPPSRADAGLADAGASSPDLGALPDAEPAPDGAPADAAVRDAVALPDAGASDADAGAETADAANPGFTLTVDHCGSAVSAHAPGTPLFVGGGGTEGRTASTLDGETWHEETTVTQGPSSPGHTRNLIRGMGYGDGLFVAVGGSDNAYLSVSCDGEHWRQDVLNTNVSGDPPPDYDGFLSGVAFQDGVFVAAGGAGIRLSSHDYGLTWVPTGAYVDGHFRGIAAGNGRFVTTGADWIDGSGISSTSLDGDSWTPVLTTPGGLDRGIVFASGRFLSMGRSRCAWSVDGLQWTECGPRGDSTDQGVLFAVRGEFFIGFLDGQWTRSSDGETWSAPTPGWLPDTVDYGAGRYVMSSWGHRGYSTTGIDQWTEFSFPTDWGLGRIVFGETRYSPQ